MKKNRFTGWNDGEIAEYIRIEKSNHATTSGFWVGATIGVCLLLNSFTDDVGGFFLLFSILGIGALCVFSVEKGKKKLLELERRQRRND